MSTTSAFVVTTSALVSTTSAFVATLSAAVAIASALVSNSFAVATSSEALAAAAAFCAASTSAPTKSGMPSILVSVNKPPLAELSVAPVNIPGLAAVVIILTLFR